MNTEESKISEIIRSGGVGVLPTDTLYGLVCSAFNEDAVERVYELKKRDRKKASIILISSIDQVKEFGVSLDDNDREKVAEYWPGRNTLIFKCNDEKFSYLHKNLNSLAFRLPDNERLIKVLQKTGPIIAPSANKEGEPPAENTDQAKLYFGDDVDFYIDGGVLSGNPSNIIDLTEDNPKQLR